MAVDATTLIGGALGGALVQSVLGPMIGQRHERRDLRAKVLERVAIVDRIRWRHDEDREEFLRAIRELRAAALIAGIKREPIDFYALVAAGSRQACEASAEEVPEGEFIGIPSELGELVEEAGEVLTSYLWHPYLRRLTLRRDLKRLEAFKDEVTEDLDGSSGSVRWDWGLPGVVARS